MGIYVLLLLYLIGVHKKGPARVGAGLEIRVFFQFSIGYAAQKLYCLKRP